MNTQRMAAESPNFQIAKRSEGQLCRSFETASSRDSSNRPLSGTVATVRYQLRVHLRQSEVGLVAQKLRFLAATENLPQESPQKALAETGFGTQSESQGEYHGTRTYSFVRRSKPQPRHD